MTSLIFGSIYLAHQGIVAHKQGKKRQKNYERWEDLRDEYDLQKKTNRETRSLDIQRTGIWDPQNGQSAEYTAREERPILTLRDQQEANDARLSWRPQESWEGSPGTSSSSFETASQRSASISAIPAYLQPQSTYQPAPQQPNLPHAATTPSTYWQARGEIKPQRTGATWDDGLPAPLKVTRRSYEDYDQNRRVSAPVQQSQQYSSSYQASPRQSRDGSTVPSRTQTPVQIQTETLPSAPTNMDELFAKMANISVEPVQSHVPGGRMAELIERGY